MMNVKVNEKSVAVSQFRYKGAEVRILRQVASLSDPRVIERINEDSMKYQSMASKYGITNNPFRTMIQNMRSVLKGSSGMTIEVTMGGETRTIRTEGRELGRYYRYKILDERRAIIRNLRNRRDRYSKAQVQDLSVSSVSHATNVRGRSNYIGNYAVGYVHAEAGTILRLHEARLSQRMFQEVRPKDSTRHVGIEIECGIKVTRERLGYLLREYAGYVMVKGDGSVGVADRTSVELNICAPLNDYKRILKGVTDILNSDEVGAKVNKSCGLHVHLDIREWRDNFTTLQDKFSKLMSVQGILYSMQPKSRQSNTYCQKGKTRNITRGATRYMGINAQAIWKYSTIETRLHAGTTDYLKIANWIDLLSGIMYSNGETPKRALSKVDSVFKYYSNLPYSLKNYINERVRLFSDGTQEEAEVSVAV